MLEAGQLRERRCQACDPLATNLVRAQLETHKCCAPLTCLGKPRHIPSVTTPPVFSTRIVPPKQAPRAHSKHVFAQIQVCQARAHVQHACQLRDASRPSAVSEVKQGESGIQAPRNRPHQSIEEGSSHLLRKMRCRELYFAAPSKTRQVAKDALLVRHRRQGHFLHALQRNMRCTVKQDSLIPLHTHEAITTWLAGHILTRKDTTKSLQLQSLSRC